MKRTGIRDAWYFMRLKSLYTRYILIRAGSICAMAPGDEQAGRNTTMMRYQGIFTECDERFIHNTMAFLTPALRYYAAKFIESFPRFTS